MPRISIALMIYGVAGWEWTETYQIMGETKRLRCRTDRYGWGLWHWQRTGPCRDGHYAWKAIDTPKPFSLPALWKAAYNKIRRRTAAHLDFLEGR